MIYHLPDVPVFVDGRTDLYGDEILDDYIAVINGDDNWEEILQKHNLDLLLLQNGSHISKIASYSGWEIVYQDKIAVILTEPN